MNFFGQYLRNLRENRGILLRQLAAQIETDTALISKIENGERKATRDQVKRIASFFELEEKELLTLWLADKVYKTIDTDKDVAEKAIDYVKKHMKKR